MEKNGTRVTSKLNLNKEMIFIGKSLTILTYEHLSASEYIEKINQSIEFKFLQHIRNGAAHNNKFDLKYRYGKNKGQWRIGENEKIEWNNMIIYRELQDKNIFNDFISMFSILLLAKHFSDKLNNIDKLK